MESESGTANAAGKSERGSFTSRIGFVLSTAGCAVGLGNLWRFPYLADKYGGGTFLFVYVILVAIFGLTLMVGEIAIGRKTGKSCVDAFRELSAKHSWIGVLAAIVPMVIASYYCVIGGWVLKYFFGYLTLDGGAFVDSGYFPEFIAGGTGAILDSPVTWFLIFAFLTVLVVALGVQNGVERISKNLIPLLLVIMVVIIAYVFMPPPGENGVTVWDGVKHYIVPNFEDLSISTVLGASSQLFYSLSIGTGILITYGSYMKKEHCIVKSSKQVICIDMAVAFMAGLMILPPAYMLGGDVCLQGTGLMFQSMPMIFETMPAGQLIGLLFFFLVVIAAITSSISLAETVVSSLCDRLKWTRRASTSIVLLLIIALGMFSCLGYGPLDWFTIGGHAILDVFDLFSNNLLMPIVSLLTCLIIGYVIKPKAIIAEVEKGEEFHHANVYVFIVKYLCPVFLVMISVLGIAGIFGYISL